MQNVANINDKNKFNNKADEKNKTDSSHIDETSDVAFLREEEFKDSEKSLTSKENILQGDGDSSLAKSESKNSAKGKKSKGQEKSQTALTDKTNQSGASLYQTLGNEEEIVYLNNTQKEDESDKAKEEFLAELNKKQKKVKRPTSSIHKKSFKQRMKTLGILTVLGIFTGCGLGVWYFNTAVVPPIDYSQYNASDYIVSAESVLGELFRISSDYENWRNSSEFLSSGIKSPRDLTPAQNFLLAEYNALNSDYFHIVGTGEVNVKAFGIPISQTVYSEKNFDGNTYTFESISEGTMPLGTCSVMEKPSSVNSNPSVMLFSSEQPYTSEGGTIADNAVWGDYETYSQEEYRNLAGGTPNSIQTYIISDKTIISPNVSSAITYDAETGYYSFTIELNPITSVLNYVKQVQQTSGLDSAPTFSSISQTITIDSEWNLVSISIEESYSLMYGPAAASCEGTLNSIYYLNQPELIDFPDLPIEL